MSTTALIWVGTVLTEFEGLGACERALLWALANRHNQSTGRCDPSIEMLASDTGFSERKIRYSMRVLEAEKLVKVFRKCVKGTKRNYPNTYVFRGARGAGHGVHVVQGKLGIQNKPIRPASPFDLVIDEASENGSRAFVIDDSADDIEVRLIGSAQ